MSLTPEPKETADLELDFIAETYLDDSLLPSPFEEFDYPDRLESEPTKAYYGPPGTGKTYQLKQDVNAELERGTDPFDICATSYRVEMANALAAAVSQQTGEESAWLSTTHSICLRLTAQQEDVDVAAPEDRAEFCEEIGMPFVGGTRDEPELDPDSPYTTGSPATSGDGERRGNVLFEALSVLKNTGANYDHWKLYSSETIDSLGDVFGWTHPNGDDVRLFERKWEEYKRRNGLVDFEDMLLAGAQHYVPPTNVLIEDEFQDKTPLQVAVHNHWAEHMDRVYVSGDPHQAIYGYMGTDPKFMEQALEQAGESVTLTKSYRNSNDVTAGARRILRDGGYSPAEVEGSGDGVMRRISMAQYHDLVVDRQDESTFHLFRTNRHKAAAATVLSELGIPFQSEKGARWSVKQRDFFNAVAKGHHAATEATDFGERPDFSNLTNGEANRLVEALSADHWETTKGDFEGFGQTDDELVDVVDIRALAEILQPTNPLAELGDDDSPFIKSTFSSSVRERLKETWKRRDGRPIESFDHRIETIHASKGREADTVFLFDTTSGAAQYDPWLQEGDPEEMRVWYVGATRSRGDCYIVEGYDTPSQELPI